MTISCRWTHIRPQVFDDTFPNDMVWQASEGLCADDVGDPFFDEFHHLSGQEPTFAGLVSDRNVGCRKICQMLDFCRWNKMDGTDQFPNRCPAELFQRVNTDVRNVPVGPTAAKMFIFVALVVHAIEEEIGEVRHDCFGAFRFKQFDDMVVGKG